MKKEDITYEVIENLGVLSECKGGWKCEVNLISWNGKEPVVDIRSWSPDKSKMGKGITLNKEEAQKLLEILNKNIDKDCE